MKQFLLIAYRAASTIRFNRMYSKINEKLIHAYVCTDASDYRHKCHPDFGYRKGERGSLPRPHLGCRCRVEEEANRHTRGRSVHHRMRGQASGAGVPELYRSMSLEVEDEKDHRGSRPPSSSETRPWRPRSSRLPSMPLQVALPQHIPREEGIRAPPF